MPDPALALRLRVGRAIRRLRTERRYSQERLGHLARSSGKHIGAIERGDVEAGLDVLGRIAAALAVDAGELVVAPLGRGRGDEVLHLSPRDDLDRMLEILQRVREGRAPRTPRASK